MSDPDPALTIVTGASAAYGRCLWQMLHSAVRRGLPGRHRFVAFDLGLAARQHTLLARDFPWCEWRRLDFASLPAHVAVSQRTYAWKPLALQVAATEFGGAVLWLDSATLFRSSLDPFLAELCRHPVYTLAGQSQLQARCDPEVWTAAGAPLEILDQPERAAGVIGFDTRQPVARRLLEAWRDLALDPRVWRPLSARHKPEQALLSILLLRAVRAGELTLNPGEIDIGCPAPVRWLSSRNKVPTWLPRWTDPGARLHYSLYKAVDRLVLRLRRFKSARVNGWHRYPKECFRVLLTRVTLDQNAAAPVLVPAPRTSYYADPFLWCQAGRSWLFVEEFRYAENAGRLVALPLDTDLRVTGPAVPLDLPRAHVSFPHLVAHDDQVYLLPETSGHRTVDLFVGTDFPGRWRLQRRLLADIDAADSVLLRHAGRWWLFTSVRLDPARPARALAVYHTDNLLQGVLQPHPINAERRYAGAGFSSGRCAGAFIHAPDGAWLRPVHASRRYYGQGLRFMSIAKLTPTEFQETEYTGDHPLAALARRVSPHHISVAADCAAYDVRTRVSYGQHVPLWRRWANRPEGVAS